MPCGFQAQAGVAACDDVGLPGASRLICQDRQLLVLLGSQSEHHHLAGAVIMLLSLSSRSKVKKGRLDRLKIWGNVVIK